MTITGQIEENRSVYPGEYIPEFDILDRQDEFLPEGRATQPVYNVIECPDHYKIEIVAPGHSRDDFILMTDKGQLNIFAIQRKLQTKEQSVYHSQEFNHDCFEHSILLPKNIDTDFISAEYKAGILCVCFPKTDEPVLHHFQKIIVY